MGIFDHPCPGCADTSPTYDSAQNFDTTKKPTAGDWVLCAYCGTISRVEDDLTLRHATATEFVRLAEDCPVMALQMHCASTNIHDSNTPVGPVN